MGRAVTGYTDGTSRRLFGWLRSQRCSVLAPIRAALFVNTFQNNL